MLCHFNSTIIGRRLLTSDSFIRNNFSASIRYNDNYTIVFSYLRFVSVHQLCPRLEADICLLISNVQMSNVVGHSLVNMKTSWVMQVVLHTCISYCKQRLVITGLLLWKRMFIDLCYFFSKLIKVFVNWLAVCVWLRLGPNPNSSYQLQVTSYQWPVTSHQSPVTSYQLPVF